MYSPFHPTFAPGGIRLPHADSGPRDGTPVLLLHGLSDSLKSFDPPGPHLPDSMRAIAATQRGHGDAPKPEAGYGVEHFAGDALRLLDSLEIERAVVVGHSFGAWVATKLAADNPERVSGLVLAGALGPVAGNPAAGELFAEIAQLEDPVPEEFVAEFQAGTAVLPLADGLLDAFVAESMKLPAHVWREIGRDFSDIDLSHELPRISAPTRILWGDRDPIATLVEQRALLAAIPQAELSVFEGTGHALQWESPERFADELARFAESLGGVRE